MYHLLQKHKRRLLAFATAFLMVAFLIPTVNRFGSGSDPAIGKVNGKKVYASAQQNAMHQWQLLTRKILLVGGQAGYQPVAALLGQTAFSQIEQYPEMFLLLQLDARKQGIYVTEQSVDELFKAVQVADMDMTNLDNVEAVRNALQSLLTVRGAFGRAASAIHVSEPQRNFELATQLQELKLSAVDFTADSFMKQVPEPSQEQLQAFFDKYRDVDPATVDPQSTTNPFGFGFKFPDRSKLQYLEIPMAEIRNVVLASRSDYDWSKEAYKEYVKHANRYTAATTQPGVDASGLGLVAQPSATTRPFEQAKEDAKEAVVTPEVQKLAASIVNRINSIIVADWTNYRGVKPGEKAPASTMGAPYDSYDYLQKLAAQIQKEFKVRLTIGQVADLLSADDLKNLAQLGSLRSAQTNTQVTFPQYATLTEASHKVQLRTNPNLPPALKLFQPSQRLEDGNGNVFMFRLTEVSLAHTPKDIAEAGAQRVAQDYKKQQAFEVAQKAADEFVQAAKQGSLAKVAEAQKKNVVSVSFMPGNTQFVSGLHLSDEGNKVFLPSVTTTLLTARAAGDIHPVAAVPVARDGRIVVTQLDAVNNKLPPEYMQMIEAQLDTLRHRDAATRMEQQWFAYRNVVQRTQYEPSERTARQNQSEDTGAPTGPAGPLGL